jgi:3-hydroxybutyrate dehydrogenase
VLAVNLSSNFHTIRAALPAMLLAARGRIVNVASAHGLGVGGQGRVRVGQARVLGLTKVVALETATTGVTC